MLIISISLFLLFIFLYGTYTLPIVFIHTIKEKRRTYQLLLPLLAFAYILFMILFTLNYRNFYNMKDIYIYPGLLGFISIFVTGLTKLWRTNNRKIRFFFFLILLLIVFINILDIFQLTIALLKTRI